MDGGRDCNGPPGKRSRRRKEEQTEAAKTGAAVGHARNDKRENRRGENNAQGMFSPVTGVARYLGASTRHLYFRARVRYKNSRYSLPFCVPAPDWRRNRCPVSVLRATNGTMFSEMNFLVPRSVANTPLEFVVRFAIARKVARSTKRRRERRPLEI